MSGYLLSVDADADPDEVWEYIDVDNVDAADRWIGKLFEAFEALGRYTRHGHVREDVTPHPVLFWPLGAYLIIYYLSTTPSACPLR